MARLAKLKEAGIGELREKAELQEALVRCAERPTLLPPAQRSVSSVCTCANLTARGS